MKIVFIVGSYYPYFSAIGKCVYNLVKKLENNHDIIVLSDMDISKFPVKETYEMHEIIRVRSKSMKKRDELIFKQTQSDSLMRRWYGFRLMIVRIMGALKIIASNYSIQTDLVNEYYQALCSIEDIDLIIPTCYPFESIIAALKYKDAHDNVQIKPVLFDKYSESPTLHRSIINKKIKFKNHLNLERKMLIESQEVFVVDSWIEHIDKYFTEYKDKIVYIEHPLIIDYTEHKTDKKNLNSSIDIVYTGVLDKKVRPPQKTLNILAEVIKRKANVKVHFYILGNCENIVNRYNKKYPENIINHGQIESSKALDVICQSDILLSIGNTDVTLIPSKIFEYMSCGKPIIHFYTSDADRIIEMLDKYGLALCLKQVAEPSEKYINTIISFIQNVDGLENSFTDVSQTFFDATPGYIVNKIINSNA